MEGTVVSTVERGNRMKCQRLGLISAAVLLLSFAAFPSELQPDQRRLQQLVEQLREENGLPGISVAVATGDSAPLLAFDGFSDVEHDVPVTAETPFFIGSVSKNLFSTVVLMLADDGLLGLDDPLSRYVEWPRGDEVTVRMLLNHTSGIPDYMTSDLFENSVGGVPVFFSTSRPPTEILAKMPRQEPTFDPGSKQEYSNTNFLLAGRIIEEVTGDSLATVLDRRVVKPLGLKHMYLFGSTTSERPRARGYSAATQWGGVDGRPVDCTFADEALPDSADGSVVTNAGDLLRYHRALRNGELLSESSWVSMTTVEAGRHHGLSYLLGKGPFGPYAGNVGRAMGHVAFNVYYLDHDLYVVILLNRGDSQLNMRQFMEPWLGASGS